MVRASIDGVAGGDRHELRHEGRGYVSAGVSIPASNFTATLAPRNADEAGFEPTSRSELPTLRDEIARLAVTDAAAG